MKKMKKGLKLMFLILLIILATVGIALTGVAPTFQNTRDRNKKEETEQLEEGLEKAEELELEKS